ncbi:MAG TPA: efflux RND transporter periplasmic adaptor subunit [Candidatus Acidoferrales bacterium]
MNKPRQHVHVAAAILLAAVLQFGCAAEKKPEAPAPTPVTVAEVQQYSGSEGVNYSASIVPYQQVPVAFKSAGYVTSILQRKGVDGRVRNLQMGDWVKKGTVMATVRQADYQQAVDQYKGQLAQAQASAQKSSQDFARAQALYNASAMTQSDFDAAKAQNDSSQGSVAAAQAAVAQAQQALSDCEVRAPFDSQVLSRSIELGALVSSGTTAFTIGETQTVKAVFGIPDSVLSSVTLGKKQSVQTESYPQSFPGQITAIAPQADQKSRTFQVEVTLPNPQGLLKSGMVATLILEQSTLPKSLLVVPIGAIVSAGDTTKTFSVFVVDHEGGKDVARRKTVEPGAAFGNMVAISTGVAAGDRVLLNGATLVNDGQAIRIIQ